MARTILNILFLTILCCLNTPLYSQKSVTFDREALGDGCGSGFTVNNINDTIIKKEMELYLHKVFYEPTCEITSEILFESPFFKKIIIEIITSEYFEEYSIYEYTSRWKESYVYLLTFCTNDEVFYDLCDTLLELNLNLTITAVWDRDISKLKNLKKYTKRNNTNLYILAELVCVYHNNGMNKERDKIIKQLKKVQGNNDISFLKLLEEKKVDYIEFIEAVYGGI